MTLTTSRVALFTACLLSACASSYADASGRAHASPARPSYDDAVADPRAFTSGPYRVEVQAADASQLPTFFQDGRAYVMGTMGERYRVHITNPTNARVEAVVSIDGLDAVDGEPADFASKHGYVIAPGDDLVVEGFRTSLQRVAAFRFSSVVDSYAGRKGKDRHVGVIGVAFFPERTIYRAPPIAAGRHWERSAPAPPAAAGPRARASAADEGEPRGAAAPAAENAAPSSKSSAARRAGLGTEFGEARESHVEYTRFERASATAPAAVFEVRYNDRSGLLALGIDVDRTASDDLTLRETADPFPAHGFASPPPR